MDAARPIGTTPMVLDPDARWISQPDGLLISNTAFEARVRGLNGERAKALLEAIDAGSTSAELAQIAGGTPEDCLRWLAPLIDAQIVLPHDAPSASVSPEAFCALCRSNFPEWKRRLFSHPLWRSLAEGAASRNVFLGWLLESYHFIEGVTLRLPMCICSCWNPRMRSHFVRHFSEEYDHRRFFLKSLNAAGIADAQTRHPLPGTRAVLNCMREAARRDPLAYAACSAFLESTGADRTSARTFFDLLARHYDSPGSPIVAPMAEHVGLDESYGHGGFIEKICGTLGVVTREQADAALDAAWLLLETLEFWSQDILEHYSVHSPASAAPRRYRLKQSPAVDPEEAVA